MPTVAAREALRITPESTIGTYNSSGTHIYIRLTSDNAFTGIPTPMRWAIRDASSSNRLAQTGYGTVGTKASLVCPWYFSQSAALFAGAIATGSPPVQTSFTIDHLTMMEDASSTLIYTRYLGCFINKLGITAGNSGDNVVARTSYDFDYLAVSAITVSDFAMPALSTYPSDQPVIFQMSAGAFTTHGARTSYRMIELNITNILDVIYDESKYPQAIKWCGRDVGYSTEFRFKALTDRTDMQAVTAQSASIAFTDGTNTGTFNFEAQNYTTAVDDQLSLSRAHYQRAGYTTYLDYSAGLDIVYTQTP